MYISSSNAVYSPVMPANYAVFGTIAFIFAFALNDALPTQVLNSLARIEQLIPFSFFFNLSKRKGANAEFTHPPYPC